MGHTHINTIETLSPCNNDKKQENRVDPVSLWMMFQIYTKFFLNAIKMETFSLSQASTINNC